VGSPAAIFPSEAEAIWADATRDCADVHRYNAEIRPSGRIAGGSVRGVRLLLAVTDKGEIGLEAVAGTQTQFLLKGTSPRAQLWLPAERRIVTAPASRILEAFVGLDVDPTRLLAVLSGCVAVDRQRTDAGRFGDLVRLSTADSTVYLAREEDRWRIVAGDFERLSVEYAKRNGAVPGRVRITTHPGQTPAVDLSLSIETVVVNSDLPPEAFRVNVPPDAIPAAVTDLRPLGSRE
jgi:hypothetical protein